MITFSEPLYLDDCIVHYLGRWQPDRVPAAIPEHMHGRFYELTVITDGSGTVFTGNVPTNVRKGDVYLSFPFELHRIHAQERLMEYEFMSFEFKSSKFGEEFSQIWSSHFSPENRVIRSERILTLMEELLGEYDTLDAVDPVAKHPFSHEYLSAVCREILVCVLRGFLSASAPKAETDRNASKICRDLVNYIDTHLYSMKSLREAADALGYNYSYLSNLYRKTTNATIGYYYLSKRMDAAKMLLAQNKMSVSQTAEILGYSGIYAFSRAFRRHFGVPPGVYAAKVAGQSAAVREYT